MGMGGKAHHVAVDDFGIGDCAETGLPGLLSGCALRRKAERISGSRGLLSGGDDGERCADDGEC